MAAGKEIRTKIKSVENTRKITKAMEMVAASKMRKAQDRMRQARPYADKIEQVATHFSHAHPEYRHPFLVTHDSVKRVGLILVTTDKGLCGALNTNAMRLALNKMKEWDGEGVEVDVTAIGGKGAGFMQRLGANMVSQVIGLGDTPHLEKLIGPVQVMGVPACALYFKTTSLDLLLPRLLAGLDITRRDLARMGHGAFCRNCKTCTFPQKCPFGK